jgi:hypothetical protein
MTSLILGYPDGREGRPVYDYLSGYAESDDNGEKRVIGNWEQELIFGQ